MVDLSEPTVPPPPRHVVVVPGGSIVTETHAFAQFSTGPAVCVSTTDGVHEATSWYPTRLLRVVMLP